MSAATPATPITFARLRRARNLRPGELLPPCGVEDLDIEPQLAWVYDNEGRLEAALVALASHGMVVPIRLWAAPTASTLVIKQLIARFLDDCRKREYKVAVVCLDPDNKAEMRLLRIIARLGGTVVGKGVVVAGRL